LNLNLREAHGYTYGARSTLGFNLSGASWSASASVSQAVTVDALKELLYELGRMQSEPITEKEMVFARDYYLGSIPLKYENPDYLLTQIQSIWRYQLPSTWSTDLITGLKAATLEGIQQQWSAKIGNQPCYMVVVGEWAKVGAGIQELAIKEGLEVIQVKKDGTRSSDGN
jgi:predicted Zn-dependent peptidase